MSSPDIAQIYRSLQRRTKVSLAVMGVTALVGGLIVAAGEYMRDHWGADAQRLQQDLARVEGTAVRLREDIAFVTDNTERYEQTLARGLFGERNRLLARRALERQLVAHRLQGNITLQPRAEIDTHRVGGDDYAVLSTPVLIAAEGMLDSDLFTLFRDLGTAVPGYMVFQEAVLGRAETVSEENLETLRNGLPVPLVTGRMTYQWMSAGPAGTGEATQ